MSGIEHNAFELAARYRSAAEHVERELADEVNRLAEKVASRMRVNAPKSRSNLANSIAAKRLSDFRWRIWPAMGYAINVEKGRKPGKGLPRFFDPAAGSIVAWLRARIGEAAVRKLPSYRPGKIGSARRTADELALRDRYMALSRKVKARGIPAQPFVKPTADEFRPIVGPALQAALQRGLRRGGFK